MIIATFSEVARIVSGFRNFLIDRNSEFYRLAYKLHEELTNQLLACRNEDTQTKIFDFFGLKS